MDKELKRGIYLIFIANMINVIFSLLANFLLPKYLSVESYAAIKTFQLYVSYVGLFHLGYIDGMYLKYGGSVLGKELNEDFAKNISTMHWFQLCITIMITVFALFSHDWIIVLFAISILPQNIASYFKFLYQATGAFNLYGKIMNLSTISTFALNMILLFVFRTDQYLIYVFCYVILYYVIWMILEIQFKRQHIIMAVKKFSWKELTVNIRDGILLTLGNLASMLLTSMDRWFVKAFLTIFDFAQYSFAVSVENFLNVAITPITTTLYNFFCRERNVEKQSNILRYVLVFATILPAVAFPVKFILECFLNNYIDSTKTMFYLFAAQMFYIIIKSVFVNLYKVEKKQKIYFIKLVIILGVGFGFNILCYAVIHVKEAFALGTLFSATVWFFITVVDFRKLNFMLREYIYLLGQVILFLVIGLNFKSVLGFVLYICGTFIMLSIFMRDTLKNIVMQIKTYIKKENLSFYN